MQQHLPNVAKNVGDGLSVVSVIVAISQWLSPLLTICAALLTIVWTGLRIVDLWERRRERQERRREVRELRGLVDAPKGGEDAQ